MRQQYNPNLLATEGRNIDGVLIDPTMVMTASGTNTLVVGLHIAALEITDTGATITSAVSCYIAGAPTEGGTNNYALWVDSGAVRIDGAMTLGDDLVVDNQLAVGGAVVTGAKLSIEAGDVARDLVTSVGTGLHLTADTQAINAAGNGETKAIASLVFVGIPTWTSVGTTLTLTDAATVYIQGAPVGSTNTTATGGYALWVDDGAVRIDGSRSEAAAYVTDEGAIVRIGAGTVEGNNASGTIARGCTVSIGIATFNNDTATLTMTNSASLYIQGVPVGNTQVTLTNPAYALWVDAGPTQLDGTLTVGGTLSVTGVTTLTGQVIAADPVVTNLDVNDVDAEDDTLLAADIKGGLTIHTSVTQAGNVQIDTAANIVAGVPLSNNGDTAMMYYVNDGAFALTFDVNTGLTISDVANTLAPDSACIMIFRRTDATNVVMHIIGST